MKTIKQFREEYDSEVLEQNAPDELMLEGRESDSGKTPRVQPSFNQMPAMLLFRRVAYRLYPHKQVVALYYSKTVDKYLSVPFGPDGNLNLSESSVFNTYEDYMLDEGAKWEAAKGALSGAVHGTIRGGAIGGAIAPGPGTAIGAVVGGVRGAIKGGKRGYEKGKAMRKWNCEESFKAKLSQMREEKINEGLWDWVEKLGKKVLYPPDDLSKAGGQSSAVTKMADSRPSSKQPKVFSGFSKGIEKHHDDNTIASTRYKQKLLEPQKPAPVKENKISDIQNMISEGHDTMNMSINGRSITLNNSMAKKIIRVYESVNTKNKKIVESMLNEDLDSFKKLLNFSIKA
jgi:hypothetical protein